MSLAGGVSALATRVSQEIKALRVGKVDTTDARLTNARTPTAHTHPASQISDATTVGRSVMTAADAAAARTAIGAGTSSLVLGTTAGTAASGVDSRLTNARTPTAHASTHATGGTDALTPASIGAAAASHSHSTAQVTGLDTLLGTYGRDRGSGTTLPSTDLRRGDVYAHTGWDALAVYTGTAWRAIGDLARVDTIAQRDALTGVYPGLRCEVGSTGVIFVHTGSGWGATTQGVLIRGKMWRTAGSAAMNANTEYLVGQGASRLSGGFTFDAPSNSLIIPYDGIYDINAGYYVLGNVTGQATGWLRRDRTGVAAATISNSPQLYKPTAAQDASQNWVSQGIPLKANDKISQVVWAYVSGLSYFGSSNENLSFVTMTYMGPLNGASPL